MNKFTIGMLLGSLALPVFADDSDLIEGFRTNAFYGAAPTRVDGLQQSSIESNPGERSLMAKYSNQDDTRAAQLLMYTAPDDTPVEEYHEDVFESTLEEMGERYGDANKRVFDTPEGVTVSCADGMQNENISHSICMAVVKGRIIDVQPVTIVNEDNEDDIFESTNPIVVEIIDSFYTM